MSATKHNDTYVYNSITTFIHSFIFFIHKKSTQYQHNLSQHSLSLSLSSSQRFSELHIPNMFPMVLSQVATGLSVLAGAVLVKSVMDHKTMAGPFPRCPTCNGTGRVTCMCSRWSDGDIGCRTCAGSGRMACSSCGGTGTGRPLPARIAVRSPDRPS